MTNLQKEICNEIRDRFPSLRDKADRVIIRYTEVYLYAWEKICNKGMTISQAVQSFINENEMHNV